MIDKSRPPVPVTRAAKPLLPAFTPVPRHYNRHDGWTPERQLGFIEALADLGSVRAAAHAVNMTPEGAYHLRRHAEAGELRAAWDAALKLGVQRLEDVAMDRALNGIDVPVHSYGKLIGTRKVFNDALLMFILRNRAKKRFRADNLSRADAATKGQLTKLRKQWRGEWEREAAAAALAEHAAVGGELDRKLAEMHRRWYCELGAEARAAYAAFRTAEHADRAAARAAWENGTGIYAPEDDTEDGTEGSAPEAGSDSAAAHARAAARALAAEHAAAAITAEYEALFGPHADPRPTIWHYIDVQFAPEDRPA